MSHASRMIMLGIIIVGLGLMFLGASAPKFVFLGVDGNSFLTNIGIYIAVIVSLQWLSDETTKTRIVKDVREQTIKTLNIATSGLSDFLVNSRDVKYGGIVEESETIIVGVQYSSRMIDDYYEQFLNRAIRGKKTKFLISDSKGAGVAYLNRLKESPHIEATLQKTERKIAEINKSANVKAAIEIFRHDRALKYSFVYSETSIWIKPYRNSLGDTRIPAFQIAKNSPLFEFYSKDVLAFLEQAQK